MVIVRHRMNIGMNREFEVELTAKDGKNYLQPKLTNPQRRPTTTKLEASNTTNFSDQSTLFRKFIEASTENFLETLESTRQ